MFQEARWSNVHIFCSKSGKLHNNISIEPTMPWLLKKSLKSKIWKQIIMTLELQACKCRECHGKFFFTKQTLFLKSKFLTIWLVGCWLTLATQRWNRNWASPFQLHSDTRNCELGLRLFGLTCCILVLHLPVSTYSINFCILWEIESYRHVHTHTHTHTHVHTHTCTHARTHACTHMHTHTHTYTRTHTHTHRYWLPFAAGFSSVFAIWDSVLLFIYCLWCLFFLLYGVIIIPQVPSVCV